jgi:YesN/AraC family two-component response regulator
MRHPYLLLITFLDQEEPSAKDFLQQECSVQHIANYSDITQIIRDKNPDILCFEYDYPDLTGLMTLRKTRTDYPSIPVIMITEQSSEALAIWAFRSRVWDYFVKPLSKQDLLQRIRPLFNIAQSPTSVRRPLKLPPALIPAEARFQAMSRQERMLNNAMSYTQQHFREKISQSELSGRYGMSTYQFSRTFKGKFGITFRNYVTQMRVSEAKRLLNNRNLTVTEVCFASGFNDVSFFIRMFRNITGTTPSQYRKYQTNAEVLEKDENGKFLKQLCT